MDETFAIYLLVYKTYQRRGINWPSIFRSNIGAPLFPVAALLIKSLRLSVALVLLNHKLFPNFSKGRTRENLKLFRRFQRPFIFITTVGGPNSLPPVRNNKRYRSNLYKANERNSIWTNFYFSPFLAWYVGVSAQFRRRVIAPRYIIHDKLRYKYNHGGKSTAPSAVEAVGGWKGKTAAKDVERVQDNHKNITIKFCWGFKVGPSQQTDDGRTCT